MKPYYEQDGIVIYHGDCREVLADIAAESVDLIATDPPYGIKYVTARRSRDDALVAPIANDEDLHIVGAVVPELRRVLKNDRHWYAFASPRRIPEAREAVAHLGGGTKQILAWDKGDLGTVGDLKCGFGEAWEAILYGMKGRRQLFGKRPRTVIRYDWRGSMDPVHPTVKPVPLLEKLISWSSLPGELVLDPFMGSGTTLRAAKNLGRNAIGIELEERYCEAAANRFESENRTLQGMSGAIA